MIDDIFSVPIYRTKFTDVDHLRELCLSQAFAELDGKTREQEVYFGGDIASGLFGWRRGQHVQPHQRPEFARVCDFITQAAVEYWHRMPYYPEINPQIYQSWVTVYGKGGSIRSHNHGVNIDIVAAFYISSTKDQGRLVLEHPLELLLSTQPYSLPTQHPHKFNHSIAVESGDLVLFPSWLKHHSEPNTTDSNRLVLTIDYNRTGT